MSELMLLITALMLIITGLMLFVIKWDSTTDHLKTKIIFFILVLVFSIQYKVALNFLRRFNVS